LDGSEIFVVAEDFDGGHCWAALASFAPGTS
jgi:hypothetical protein